MPWITCLYPMVINSIRDEKERETTYTEYRMVNGLLDADMAVDRLYKG